MILFVVQSTDDRQYEMAVDSIPSMAFMLDALEAAPRVKAYRIIKEGRPVQNLSWSFGWGETGSLSKVVLADRFH